MDHLEPAPIGQGGDWRAWRGVIEVFCSLAVGRSTGDCTTRLRFVWWALEKQGAIREGLRRFIWHFTLSINTHQGLQFHFTPTRGTSVQSN